MKRVVLIITALLALTTAASAAESGRTIGEWTCGDGEYVVDVTLKKYAVHDTELTFRGRFTVWAPTGKPTTGVHLKWVGKDGAILNGERCLTVPVEEEKDEPQPKLEQKDECTSSSCYRREWK
jgi:hypothetical protein